MEAKGNYFQKITERSQPSAEDNVNLASTIPRGQITKDHLEFDTVGESLMQPPLEYPQDTAPLEFQRKEDSTYADTAIPSMPIMQPVTEKFTSKMKGKEEIVVPPVQTLPAKGNVRTVPVGEISEGSKVDAQVNQVAKAKNNDKSIVVDLTKTIAKEIAVTGSDVTPSGFDDQSLDFNGKVSPDLKVKEHYMDRYHTRKKAELPGSVERPLANKRVLQLNETINMTVPTKSGITSSSPRTKSEPSFSIGKITVEVVQPQTPVTIVKHQVHHSNGVQSRQEFSSINKLSFGLSQL